MHKTMTLLLAGALSAGGLGRALAAENEAGHNRTPVTMNEVPAAAQKALKHEAKGGKLEELRTRRVGLLSGGEQQMLAVGRALARKPRLLLLDELSLGLAPVIVESLLPVVREYAQASGCGVLLVEQHVQLALEVADRGYVLSHGEIVLHEQVEALRADRQLLIASYLGEQQVPIGEKTAN